MIKLMITARTTPRRPRAEALAHLRQVHGPLVYDAPADAGTMPSAYMQNHVVETFELPAELAGWRADADLVTEVWFEDMDHLKASTATDYYRRRLKPDEDQFVDQASVRPMIMVEDGQSGEPVGAAGKLIIRLCAARDSDRFDAAWRDARDALRGACAADAVSRPLQAIGAPPQPPGGVWSIWFEDETAAQRFALDRLPCVLQDFGDALETAPGFVVQVEEFSVDRLRRENRS